MRIFIVLYTFLLFWFAILHYYNISAKHFSITIKVSRIMYYVLQYILLLQLCSQKRINESMLLYYTLYKKLLKVIFYILFIMRKNTVTTKNTLYFFNIFNVMKINFFF